MEILLLLFTSLDLIAFFQFIEFSILCERKGFGVLKRAQKISKCDRKLKPILETCYSSSYLRVDDLHNPYCFLDLDLGLDISYFLDHISNLV